MIFSFQCIYHCEAPNGVRYPLVGGTRQHHFDGTNFKPRKVLENAPTPTSRVHAVLGGLFANRVASEGISHNIPPFVNRHPL